MKRFPPPEPPVGLVAYELEPGRVLFVHPLAAPQVDALSPAEQEVLALLLEGRETSEIARARGTRPRTIANQVASIYRKVGVGSRAQLAAKLLGSD